MVEPKLSTTYVGAVFRTDLSDRLSCDDGSPGHPKGILIRVYPALGPLKDEVSADVQNFATRDPNITADQLENQWYGEAQFESYRKLGREIWNEVVCQRTRQANARIPLKRLGISPKS
jgi:hypothetical protein